MMKIATYPLQLWYICGFIVLTVIACDHSAVEEKGEIIARTGDEYLTLEQAKKAIPPFIYKQDSAYALEQYRRQWIQHKLVLKEADRLDLRQHAEVQDKLQEAQHEVLREALQAHIITSQVDTAITDEEARAYYESHKEHFELFEQYVQFRHLKTENIEDARTAKRALLAGTSWEEVADNYAMEPPAAIRSAEKFYPVSSALEDIDIMNRYLQIISINEISPIQRVNGVYHFVQLTDRREESDPADLEWILDKVKNWIILDKRQRKFNSYLKNLYLKAESNNEIEVYNVLLSNSNSNNTPADSLESNPTNE